MKYFRFVTREGHSLGVFRGETVEEATEAFKNERQFVAAFHGYAEEITEEEVCPTDGKDLICKPPLHRGKIFDRVLSNEEIKAIDRKFRSQFEKP
jgi:phosphoketolase